MFAVRGERHEPVTWFTMAGKPVLSRTQQLLVQLRHGLRGELPDGALVRISSMARRSMGLSPLAS